MVFFRIGFCAKFGDNLTIDGNFPVGNKFFGFATRRDAGLRDNFL